VLLIVRPAVVIVLPVVVESNSKPPVCDQVIPDDKVKLPNTFMFDVPAIVPVNPVKFRLKQFAPTVTVTVTAPEAASK
jgi:hypothetical protein